MASLSLQKPRNHNYHMNDKDGRAEKGLDPQEVVEMVNRPWLSARQNSQPPRVLLNFYTPRKAGVEE